MVLSAAAAAAVIPLPPPSAAAASDPPLFPLLRLLLRSFSSSLSALERKNSAIWSVNSNQQHMLTVSRTFLFFCISHLRLRFSLGLRHRGGDECQPHD